METKLDLTSKDSWTADRSPDIALQFGYVLNDNFNRALQSFISEMVDGAKVTLYLGIIASGHFRKWQPRLDELPHPPQPSLSTGYNGRSKL